jgi:hypothetical protein
VQKTGFLEMPFSKGKNINGVTGYISTATFSFKIDYSIYFIEKDKFVKHIIFQ